MKLVAILATAGVAAALPAGAVAGAASAATSDTTIVQVASRDQRFSTLVRLVKEAGLVSALSGTQKLTVFAPTNAAFAKVPRPTLAALRKDKARLRSVLLYHVVKGAVPAKKVVTLRSAKTLQGSAVKIRVTGGRVKINAATVIVPDVKAKNGIIHAIDRVLIPPAR